MPLPTPQAKQVKERRQWQRLPLAVPLFVKGIDERGKEFLEFTTALNISAGGALLLTRRYLPQSSRLTLEIPSAPVPGKALSKASVRTLKARVVQVSNSERFHLCGLKFSRPLLSN